MNRPMPSKGRSAGGTALLGFALMGLAILVGLWLLRDGGSDAAEVADSSTPVETVVDTAVTTLTVPTPSTRAPSAVRVTVANGTRKSGRAGRLRELIATAGWDAQARAVDTNPKPQNDLLYYELGFEIEAQTLAARIGLAAVDVQPMPDSPPVNAADRQEANLLVIIGEGLGARIEAGTVSPGVAPTTTAASTAEVAPA